MNELNIIPIWIVSVFLCISSYAYGRLEIGKSLLVWNVILGFVFALLVVKMPIFQ